MDLADRLAKQLSEDNPEFQKVWEDPEREKQFELSCKLIELRKRINMTQQEFADRISMKQPYLSRLENGEINMSIGKLEDIVKKLGGRIHVDIEINEKDLIHQ